MIPPPIPATEERIPHKTANTIIINKNKLKEYM